MKRMELKITLTFAIMFVVGIIINGIYSVVSMDSNFFTFEVMANAMVAAMFYLGYIWFYTRRHKVLASLGLLGICFVILFASFSSEGVAGSFSGWDWKDTIMIIYYLVAAFIADYQSKKLIEEDKKPITVNINIKGDIKPEDVEVTID